MKKRIDVLYDLFRKLEKMESDCRQACNDICMTDKSVGVLKCVRNVVNAVCLIVRHEWADAYAQELEEENKKD